MDFIALRYETLVQKPETGDSWSFCTIAGKTERTQMNREIAENSHHERSVRLTIFYHGKVGLMHSLNRGGTKPLISAIWVLGLATTALFSLLPGDRVAVAQGSDKFWHSFGYLLLALPITFLFHSRRQRISAALSLVAFGVLLELAQQLVPSRSFEAGDIAANASGVLAGFLVAELLALRIHRGVAKVGTD